MNPDPREEVSPKAEPRPAEPTPPGRVRVLRPLLFEISWEVCRQVGGIYTVIRSKAPVMAEQWHRRYFLIGPYDARTSSLEFEEHRPTGAVGAALQALQKDGLDVHHGNWLVSGQPRTVLLDPDSAMSRLGEVKYYLWKDHGIAIPEGNALLDRCLAFGYLVERFLRELLAQPRRAGTRPVIAHFHEWQAASAIPALRRTAAPLSIVFTTHATLLGRYLATQDPWFYDHLPFVDWAADARRMNVEAEARLERAAAHGAHLFTTVSAVTAIECEHLLGRKPDLLLPNGLNIQRFAAVHEFQNLHRVYKEKIQQFVMAHFFPSYTFDLDRTLHFFSAGRYEYHNKGFDLTLESLARLNAKLKADPLDRTVVFFLITRGAYRAINSEVLQRRALLEEMRRNCEAVQVEFGERLFQAVAMRRDPDYNTLVDDYWKLRLRRVMHACRATSPPAIVTHDMIDDGADEVLRQLRHLNLINLPSDPVKVVYHPDFVSTTDILFGMDYDQFVRGCHLGVFPSFYEPWGYTPLECIARGIPAVTSDLSGFGTHAIENLSDDQKKGIFLVHRREHSFAQAAEELAEHLMGFCRLERRDRIELRNSVESCADQFDWQVMGKHYAEAYRLARQRSGF